MPSKKEVPTGVQGARGALPVDGALPALREALANFGAAVLEAPPGAGKTTRVPLALLDLVPPGERVVVLEPRRLAAVSAARWMARSLGEEEGETVGYAIRFDRRVSQATRVEVVTEGILTRRLQADPALEGVGLVCFDEFHERSIHTDLALALCLDARRTIREDLKVLVMSATMECAPVSALLGGAPAVSSRGKAFPVEVRYLGDDRGTPLPVRSARAIELALADTEGDVLAFLPGAGEIRACHRLLQGSREVRERGAALHPLYASLPFEEQERAILPGRERKVVLATNVAETSLTIEGISVVVDSGLARAARHHPATGLDRLVTVPASRASAEQRAGRAGRLGPGACYRLYSRHTFESMTAFAPPEILTADLSGLVLELALWGARDPRSLPWIDPPPEAAYAAARTLLRQLGALDGEGRVTGPGKAMARFPVHPRLARLLLKGLELEIPDLAGDVAALLSERDVLRRDLPPPPTADSDVAERLEALEDFRRGGMHRGGERARLRAADRTSRRLKRQAGGGGGNKAGSRPGPERNLGRLLLAAFPDRLARRREKGGDRFILATGRGARLSRRSAVRGHDLLVAVEVDAGAAGEGTIHLASAVDEETVRFELGERIEHARTVEWDRESGKVVAVDRERIGAVILRDTPFPPSEDEALPVLCRAVRSEPSLLGLDDEVRQVQGRVRLLASLDPSAGWPDLSDGSLLETVEEWLAPSLSGVKTARRIGALKIAPLLLATLTSRQRRQLEEMAPTRIPVPSGRMAVLDYRSGDVPVLAVKLQELFGLADTPTVAGGRARVLLHLLSPAGRPLQVTSDLKGFWDGAYRDVRKEMAGRYPKHPWPDDPWSSEPTGRAKPRRRR